MKQEIIISLIVSTDIFFTAVSYRSSDIRIPVLSAFVISVMSATVLSLSLCVSDFAGRFLPETFCSVVGFVVIVSIGLLNIFRSVTRAAVRKLSELDEKAFRMGSSGIMVKLYLDETSADADDSHILSVKEAALLALATSLDSACTGISCGFNGPDPLITEITAIVVSIAAICTGTIFGKKISSLDRDFSWVGGLFLIAYAVFGFVK